MVYVYCIERNSKMVAKIERKAPMGWFNDTLHWVMYHLSGAACAISGNPGDNSCILHDVL
jgi:hypothetical protein